MDEIIVVVGQTAIGKSKLAIEIAKAFDGVIINADAMQVYQGLDIATAKVSADEMEGIEHYLLDCIKPNQNFSVFEFKQLCQNLIDEFTKQKRQIVLIGGSGLYLKALLYDYPLAKTPSKDMSSYLSLSNQDLYTMLEKKDFKTAQTLHQNNRQRVLRALEMALGDQTKSERLEKQSLLPVYPVKIIGLNTDRENLYQRINERVDIMMQKGLLQEAKQMFDLHYNDQLTAHQIIGYKEFYPYFLGEYSLDYAVDKIKQHSRNLAKKQMTWFKNQMAVDWYDVDFNDFNQTVTKVIKDIKELQHG